MKDFTAKIDFSVQHISGDEDGKTGTVNYVNDKDEAKFSIEFAHKSLNGKMIGPHKAQVIFDGKNITAIDEPSKQFDQSAATTATGSLESEVPLPIGIKVTDVTDNFKVASRESTDPNQSVIRLTPLKKGKFKYTQLDLTVDKKLDLPVKIVVYATGKEVTTIKFLDPQVNTGKAKVLEATEPTGPGWTINKPVPPAAPVPAGPPLPAAVAPPAATPPAATSPK